MTSKVKKELTYLIQFRILTQARSALAPAPQKSQLSESQAIMFSTSYGNFMQSWATGPHRGPMNPISNTKKMIPSGTYAGRELLSMLEGMVELNQFEVDDQVLRKIS